MAAIDIEIPHSHSQFSLQNNNNVYVQSIPSIIKKHVGLLDHVHVAIDISIYPKRYNVPIFQALRYTNQWQQHIILIWYAGVFN